MTEMANMVIIQAKDVIRPELPGIENCGGLAVARYLTPKLIQCLRKCEHCKRPQQKSLIAGRSLELTQTVEESLARWVPRNESCPQIRYSPVGGMP
jgi:hypothetical protein